MTNNKPISQRYITEIVNLYNLSEYFTKHNLIADGEIWDEDDPDPKPEYPGMKVAYLRTKKITSYERN